MRSFSSNSYLLRRRPRSCPARWRNAPSTSRIIDLTARLCAMFIYPDCRSLDLGRRLVGDRRILGLRRLHRVHSVGGWLSLVVRLFSALASANSMPMAIHRPFPATTWCSSRSAVLILWLGWFGFNPGSTMAADAQRDSKITIHTNMAAAVGGIMATASACPIAIRQTRNQHDAQWRAWPAWWPSPARVHGSPCRRRQ